VDWGHLGTIEIDDQEHKLNGFTVTLGYDRTIMAEVALDQKLGTLLKMHEEAFRQLGGVPEEIMYDRMKTVWVGWMTAARWCGTRCFWTSRVTGDSRRGCAGRIELRPKATWNRA
jgi:transposase